MFRVQRVRQGGILSSYLFAFYLDDLSCTLNKSEVGARIGDQVRNLILYVDDICLLASTIKSLRYLLKICTCKAAKINIQFKSAKTGLQCFTPKFLHAIKELITIDLNGAVLKHIDSVKYLGFNVSSKTKSRKCVLDDEKEIQKRACEVYMRANMIRSYFSCCSYHVKRKLFQSYLSTIYCCSL